MWSPRWSALGALCSLTTCVACSTLLSLDELNRVDCVGAECGGAEQPSGGGGKGSDVAGSHSQAGATPDAGRAGEATGGRSGATNGGTSGRSGGGSGSSGGAGGSSTSGGTNGGVTGGGGSGGANGGAGTSGSNAGGAAGTSGAPAGGTAGQTGAGACQPSAVDHSCDGLDAACVATAQDAGCSATCKGAFVQGSSYMSCLAGSDFDQAEAACQANGMHLVKIDSALENATVLSLAQDDYVWVGGSNRADPNVFAWPEGTPFFSFVSAVTAYDNFAPGQPAQNVGLRCVQLMQATSGTWSNWTCSETQSFVCERY